MNRLGGRRSQKVVSAAASRPQRDIKLGDSSIDAHPGRAHVVVQVEVGNSSAVASRDTVTLLYSVLPLCAHADMGIQV